MTITDLYDAEENSVEYEKLKDSVKENFTEKEVETLKQLQKCFLEASRYVNRILDDEDTEINLDYIIRDWFGERDGQGFRNDDLMNWLSQINEAKKRIDNREVSEN